MPAFVYLIKTKRMQYALSLHSLSYCSTLLGYILLWGLNRSIRKDESDLSLVQGDFEEWFDVDDTQKMSRLKVPMITLKNYPLEEALVLQDKEVSRWMLMEIVSRAPAKFIDLLFLARQDEDTEVVHYATTLIAEISRQYDIRLQTLDKSIRKSVGLPDSSRILCSFSGIPAKESGD